jgi:glycosyltransferase involved in cell wall biosynthesis
MNIAVISGMSDDKVRARLQPLINIEDVHAIYLFRRKPIQLTKVITCSPPGWMPKFIVCAELFRFFALIYISLTKRPDLYYGIYFVPHGIYAAIAGWIFRRPVIQELIGTDRPKVLGSKMLLRMLKSAERISVRGSTSIKQLVHFGIVADKIFSSPAVNVLDFDMFKPSKVTKKFDLIYCGRMDENKQLDILVNAISTLKERHKALMMVFVGDGPERPKLEQLTNTLGLENNIIFTGDLPNDLIPVYLNQSRIFVMSSAFEGLPVAMLEALSCGLPLVVPNVGDIPDLAQHGVNALLVEQPEVDAYAHALDLLLSNDQLYQTLTDGAFKTRQQMADEFTIEKATSKFRQILTEITQ